MIVFTLSIAVVEIGQSRFQRQSRLAVAFVHLDFVEAIRGVIGRAAAVPVYGLSAVALVIVHGIRTAVHGNLLVVTAKPVPLSVGVGQ